MIQSLIVFNILIVITPWESTAITNKRPLTGLRHFRHIQNGPSTGPLSNWEIGLREALHQALLREGYWEPNLRERLNSAQLIGRQDIATPFGDVAVIARGQLYAIYGGNFILLQDPYQNDCDDCHNPRRCERNDCKSYSPHNQETLIALWSVKRLRHRDIDRTRFELEYLISLVNSENDQIIMRRNRFNYAIPGHVFVIRSTETDKKYTEYYNRKIVQTRFKPETILGVDSEGHKHVLYSYPSYISTHQVPESSSNRIHETKLYKKLIETLASKTSTTQKPQNQIPTTPIVADTTIAPKSTIHYFMPTGEEVLMTPTESTTNYYQPQESAISSTPTPTNLDVSSTTSSYPIHRRPTPFTLSTIKVVPTSIKSIIQQTTHLDKIPKPFSKSPTFTPQISTKHPKESSKYDYKVLKPTASTTKSISTKILTSSTQMFTIQPIETSHHEYTRTKPSISTGKSILTPGTQMFTRQPIETVEHEYKGSKSTGSTTKSILTKITAPSTQMVTEEPIKISEIEYTRTIPSVSTIKSILTKQPTQMHTQQPKETSEHDYKATKPTVSTNKSILTKVPTPITQIFAELPKETSQQDYKASVSTTKSISTMVPTAITQILAEQPTETLQHGYTITKPSVSTTKLISTKVPTQMFTGQTEETSQNYNKAPISTTKYISTMIPAPSTQMFTEQPRKTSQHKYTKTKPRVSTTKMISTKVPTQMFTGQTKETSQNDNKAPVSTTKYISTMIPAPSTQMFTEQPRKTSQHKYTKTKPRVSTTKMISTKVPTQMFTGQTEETSHDNKAPVSTTKSISTMVPAPSTQMFTEQPMKTTHEYTETQPHVSTANLVPITSPNVPFITEQPSSTQQLESTTLTSSDKTTAVIGTTTVPIEVHTNTVPVEVHTTTVPIEVPTHFYPIEEPSESTTEPMKVPKEVIPTNNRNNDFLTETEPYRGPLYIGTVRTDYDLDDIFGTTKSTVKPSTTTTVRPTESDISQQLFDGKSPRRTRVIFSNFYEASTANDAIPTSQSYETSVSYEVNKRNITKKGKGVEYKSNRSKLLHYKPIKISTESPNKAKIKVITSNSTDYVIYKAEYPNESTSTNKSTKEAFDDLALTLANHAKGLEYLSKANMTNRVKYRRKIYIPRSRPIRKPVRKRKEKDSSK